MSLLGTITASPMLRNYAQGAAQSATRAIANFLAPTVSVPTLIGRYKEYTAKNRFKVPDTRRAVGGKATRIGFTADDKSYDCTPHALDFPIDNLEKMEEAQLQSIVQYGATLCADVATLDHEINVVNTALTALGAGTNIDFSNDAVDPVKQIDAIIRQVMLASKNAASVKVLVGAGAWLDIKDNALFLKRFIVGQGKGSVGLASPALDNLSQLLFTNPECQMATLVQDTAELGVAENIGFVLDKDVIVFASQDNPTTLDPSFMKTFRLDGQWMVPGSYVPEDNRGEVLKMDWSEQVLVTNAPAGVRIHDHA
ncbi:MAG TPA: hypothetical protein VII43_06185 [Opitutaceae bacterium]